NTSAICRREERGECLQFGRPRSLRAHVLNARKSQGWPLALRQGPSSAPALWLRIEEPAAPANFELFQRGFYAIFAMCPAGQPVDRHFVYVRVQRGYTHSERQLRPAQRRRAQIEVRLAANSSAPGNTDGRRSAANTDEVMPSAAW